MNDSFNIDDSTLNDRFKIGSNYRYEEKILEVNHFFPSIQDKIILKIEGLVIYNDGTTAIIKVKNMDSELNHYILDYDEVCERFKNFAAIEKKQYDLQEYFCIDIMNEESRFFREWTTWQICEAKFDENGFIYGYEDIFYAEDEL